MKLHKLFTVCALLLASAGLASAQTSYLYVTGSTAFRSFVEGVIPTVFDGGAPSVISGYNGTTAGKQNCAIYSGNIGGNPWIIKTAWSGSEAGIQTVSGNVQINFLVDQTISGGVAGTPVTGLDDVTQTSYVDNGNPVGTAGDEAIKQVPDADMSDTTQSASEFNGLYQSVTYPAINEAAASPVGINVFKWIANKGSTLTAVTSQQLRALYAGGKLPLALFTGSTADEGSTVYSTGRNPDSGTRVTALLESGIGTALTTVKQYQPQNSSNVWINGSTGGNVAKLVIWPADNVNGIPIATGNSGYSSGGNLAKSLNNDYTNGGAGIVVGAKTYNNGGSHALSLVAYAGAPDADPQIGAGVVELSYNGVKLGVSADYNTNTLLTEGQYTFWSKEHMNYGNSEDANHITVINSIATALTTASGAVHISSMKVSRGGDGAVVTNNTYGTF
jgi:hypothetical protein